MVLWYDYTLTLNTRITFYQNMFKYKLKMQYMIPKYFCHFVLFGMENMSITKMKLLHFYNINKICHYMLPNGLKCFNVWKAKIK